jgi:hypothetical protein
VTSSFDPRRKGPDRTFARKVVIACEGKTERLYFEDMGMHLRARTIDIIMAPHEGTDPATVVAAAEDKRAQLKRERRWSSPGDTVWAVFDGDEHLDTDGKRQRWNDAIQRAASRDINLAVSNPSFELWYLLHFQAQNGALNRSQALSALRGHRPDYEKNRSLFSELHASGLTAVATGLASSLCAQCEDSGWHRWRNPSTRVHLLVTHLLALRPSRPG